MRNSRLAKSLATATAITVAAAGGYEVGKKPISNEAKIQHAEQLIGEHVLKSFSQGKADFTALDKARHLSAFKIKRLGENSLFNQLGDIQGLVLDVVGETNAPARDVLSAVLPESSVTALEARGVKFVYDMPANDCLNAYSYTSPNGKTETIIPLANSSTPAPTPHVSFVNSGYETAVLSTFSV